MCAQVKAAARNAPSSDRPRAAVNGGNALQSSKSPMTAKAGPRKRELVLSDDED